MLIVRLRALICAAIFILLGHSQALASQGTGCMPTTGTVSGLSFAQNVNAGLAALISSNSGASPPATDCSGVPVLGQIWVDTSTTPRVLKQYDGANWLVLGVLDATNQIWTPPIGGGIATLAVSSTVNLGSVPQAYVSLTSGTGPITSFGSSALPGTLKVISFATSATVTHNASSMILPGGTDLSASSGDVWLAAYLGSGNWRIINAQQASGQAIINPSRDIGDVWYSFRLTAPAKAVEAYGQALSRASYPDYLAAVTITQSAQRTNGSAVLTSISDVTQFGPGMPIEGVGIPSGATVGSVSTGSITMASTCGGGSSACNASSSGTSNITIFPTGYGAGGSSSTVGVPDCRANVLVGRENIGGSFAGRLSSTWFGASTTATGTQGGQSYQALSVPNLPPISYTPSGTISQALIPILSLGTSGLSPGAFQFYSASNGSAVNLTGSPQTFTGSTASLGGSSLPFPTVQPGKIANCFVRVLP